MKQIIVIYLSKMQTQLIANRKGLSVLNFDPLLNLKLNKNKNKTV